MSESLRVATFNVRHGARPSGRVSLRAMAAACAALDADVLGLQEVDRRRWRSRMRDGAAYVAARLSARHVFGVARRRGLIGAYGNALVARGELDDVEVQPLPGTGKREPRVAVLAQVQIGSIAVSVAVAHLQHFPAHLRHLPDEAPEQLEAVLAALRARPSPRVLLGDLNLQEPRAAPMITKAGFTPAATGPTFPADAPRIRLDWIAVEGLVVERAQVGARTEVSDHRPVVAEVRVAESIR